MNNECTYQDLIHAYKCGLFPMADSRDSRGFYWYDPPMRGQLPIPNLHIPAKLRKTIRRQPYIIRIDSDFEQTILCCANTSPDRPQTWINDDICQLYTELHHHGFAHSVEAWEDNKLVGGLYGVSIGAAFMGESMFSVKTDSSKICLVHLCARLTRGGFQILDTQFINNHLKQFGAYEITRENYLEKLSEAIHKEADFIQKDVDENILVQEYLLNNNDL